MLLRRRQLKEENTTMQLDLTAGPQIQITIETIWPDTALQMLEHNINNRKISTTIVDLYARDIEAERFQCNADAIRFDTNGNLIDGQHRLHAVIKANKPIRTVVARGLAPEAKATIDVGKPRSLGDHLRWLGYTRVNALAGAINLLEGWETGVFKSSHKALSRSEADAILEREPGLTRAVQATDAVYREIGISQSVAALAWHLMAKKDVAAANAFFEQIATGANLSVHDAAHTVRKTFIDLRIQKNSGGRRKSVSRKVALAYFIKGWNAYRAGKPIVHLRLGTNEPFPQIAD